MASLRSRLLGVPVFDLVLGAGLATAGVLTVAASLQAVHPWSELAAGLTLGSLVLRTRAPIAMVLVCVPGLVGYAALPDPSTSLPFFIGVLVISFSVAADLSGRRLLAVLLLLLGAGYAFQVRAAQGDASLGVADTYLAPLILVGAPALAGWLLRRSRHQTAELRRLTGELEVEREAHAAAAAVAERHRIARELHDVISHSVSVMVVQAGAAENLLPTGSPAREQVRAVRDTGKDALAELRRQLGLLRERGTATVAPMPGLDQLPRLAESMGADLEVDGAVRDVPPGLALTAYRVVQEALTNARRYADSGPVGVRVARRADALELEVIDSGGGPAEPDVRGSGNGLAGMAERVGLYGGRLEACYALGRRGRMWC